MSRRAAVSRGRASAALVLLALGTVLLAGARASALCAAPRFHLEIRSSLGAPRPAAGGIVVELGRCAGHGSFPPPRARVTLRWLDALGQLSAPSRPAPVR